MGGPDLDIEFALAKEEEEECLKNLKEQETRMVHLRKMYGGHLGLIRGSIK